MRIVRVGNTLPVIQSQALKQHYGQDVEIITVPSSMRTAQQIKAACQKLQADVLEVVIDGISLWPRMDHYSGRYDQQSVLPLVTLVQLLDPERGVKIPIITAQGYSIGESDGSEQFCFQSYSRITGVYPESEPL